MARNSVLTRLQHAWYTIFSRNDAENTKGVYSADLGPSSTIRPDLPRLQYNNEMSIVASLYNRIAIDVAAIPIKHIRLDENNRFAEEIRSPLNECLTLAANIDQTGRAFMMDVVISMFDEGSVAIIPTVTSINPAKSTGYDIHNLRTGKIIEWYPKHVKVSAYNDNTGYAEELTLPKELVAIVENPLYSVMNQPNSTLKRLIYKLNLLDAIDTQSGSGKLDLIIQLPYVIKTESRRAQAETRRKAIEDQLAGSRYGIAYADGTEKVTQLNRPAENNLLVQIEYLTRMLYSQLGLTEAIFDGTADESTMLNYYNRTIEPVLAAVVDAMISKFLTKTARTQRQTLMYIRNPFRLVPVSQLADIADKFTRNEILTSNEVRGIIGYMPADDARADELVNKNVSAPKSVENEELTEKGAEKENETL